MDSVVMLNFTIIIKNVLRTVRSSCGPAQNRTEKWTGWNSTRNYSFNNPNRKFWQVPLNHITCHINQLVLYVTSLQADGKHLLTDVNKVTGKMMWSAQQYL